MKKQFNILLVSNILDHKRSFLRWTVSFEVRFLYFCCLCFFSSKLVVPKVSKLLVSQRFQQSFYWPAIITLWITVYKRNRSDSNSFSTLASSNIFRRVAQWGSVGDSDMFLKFAWKMLVLRNIKLCIQCCLYFNKDSQNKTFSLYQVSQCWKYRKSYSFSRIHKFYSSEKIKFYDSCSLPMNFQVIARVHALFAESILSIEPHSSQAVRNF